MEKISKIDEELLTMYEDASELESAVLEAEEIHDDIMDKIARTRRFIELNSAKQQDKASQSVSQSSVILQSQGITSQSLEAQSRSMTPQSQGVDNFIQSVIQQSQSVDSSTHSATPQSQGVDTSVQSVVEQPQVVDRLGLESVGTSTQSIDFPSSVVSTVTEQPLYKSLYQSQMSTMSPVIPTHTFTPSHDTQKFGNSRLPKLTLPTFYGNPLTWQTFWDSFYVSIHANPNLSGIQKFTYLKAQLQGDTARAISGLPLKNTNYAHSIVLLEDRYAQPHILVNAHMKALLEMPSPTDNLASLRTFYDSVESHIQGLASLGKSEHSYGNILVPILMGKLLQEICKRTWLVSTLTLSGS